jgi:hypothetical protein
MATQRVHVERLIGKRVHDRDGRRVGRIEEVKAEVCDGGACRVTEFQLGSRALWKRLDITSFALAILHALGADKYPATHRVPWDQMDLSDPDRPRLKCRAEDLQTVEPFRGGNGNNGHK